MMDGTEKGNSDKKLYARMRLWEFADKYIFEPIDNAIADSYLSISRADGSMALIGELPQCGQMQSPKVRLVFGVIGMLRLIAGAYLFVITSRECVGTYLGHPIYKVSTLEILPCNMSVDSSSVEQKKMEAEFSTLLYAAEKTNGLYFSYEVNLALCAQRLHELGGESKLPLWRQADPRFLWNGYMLEALIDNNLDPYLLPVMQGSYQHFEAALGTNIIDVSLIARRCTRRTGTRMWRRGADLEGYVANFVETEQILQANGFTASFLQVRGSIPLLWEQIVDLTYKPPFQIVQPDEGPRVARRHFMDLVKRYNSVIAVNLVNKHGGEGRLSERFAQAMETISNDIIRYVHFDFHAICGHIHFERLSLLYDQIEDFLKKNSYFLLDVDGEKVQEQTGVVRTNCIDCLDRTNVTQGLLKVNEDGKINLLTDEAEGLKFKLTDGVDVSSDGLIYFTDASHKYDIEDHVLEFLEGRPNGRLISFDPSNNQTTVLARDLYFANGVAVSPDQLSIIFCESSLRRCSRYFIKGEKKGVIDKFVENLPGYPDNIKYDGEGQYWIGLSGGRSKLWDLILKYPLLRKFLMILSKLMSLPPPKEGGVLSVNLEGRLKALYSDRDSPSVTCGLKVGKHLYLGSISKGYILRIDLLKFEADI